jgi:hypothetical protein
LDQLTAFSLSCWHQETLSHSSDAASLTTNAPKALDAFRNDPWVFGLGNPSFYRSCGWHSWWCLAHLQLLAKVGLFGGSGVCKTVRSCSSYAVWLLSTMAFRSFVVSVNGLEREETCMAKCKTRHIMHLGNSDMSGSPWLEGRNTFANLEVSANLEFTDFTSELSQAVLVFGQMNETPGAITSIQAIYVPANDLTDPTPVAIFSHLALSTALAVGYSSLCIEGRL